MQKTHAWMLMRLLSHWQARLVARVWLESRIQLAFNAEKILDWSLVECGKTSLHYGEHYLM